jgi:hypothetical protein
MSDIPGSDSGSGSEIRARLNEVVRMLRQARSLDPKVQTAVAELLNELTVALAATNTPPAEVARLAESATHLADALHRQHDRGLLVRARDHLEEAMIEAEIHAPIAVGLARGLIDALASIGI